MEEQAEALAMIQRAVWLSEKLARLCRELLWAKQNNSGRDAARLEGEIDALVHSQTFAQALYAVGREHFYPQKLRVMEYLLRRGYAKSLQEAREKIEKMDIIQMPHS